MEIHATERGKKFYLAFRWQVLLCNIKRMGFALCGVNDPDGHEPAEVQKNPRFEYRAESDAEHCNGMYIILNLLYDFYPEIVGPTRFADLSFIISIHELGELPTGDIPDDGNRDEEAKDANEMEYIRNYLHLVYGEAGGEEKLKLYKQFVDKSTDLGMVARLIDKFSAIYRNFVYEYEGRPGSLAYRKERGNLSLRDANNRECTGSDLCADNWLFGLLLNEDIANFKYTKYFVEIAQSAAAIEREGREMLWIKENFPTFADN